MFLHHHLPQAQLLPSTSSISTSNSESQPPIPTCTDSPSKNMVTLLNHLPQSYQLPHHSPLFHHPLILIPYRMPRNSQKHDRGKKKKNY
ncbi:hypothetical protein TNCV_3101291 [Trichonephila clavipes]|nr:hypothetical protein TNCV_3101291 [Trichonephila clavipes]